MQKRKKNVNCLVSMRCPVCHSLEPFRIQACVSLLVTDAGTAEYSDAEWSYKDGIKCQMCGTTGRVYQFSVKYKDARWLRNGQLWLRVSQDGYVWLEQSNIDTIRLFPAGDPGAVAELDRLRKKGARKS